MFHMLVVMLVITNGYQLGGLILFAIQTKFDLAQEVVAEVSHRR